MAFLSNIIIPLACSLLIYILFILNKLLKKVWLNPIRVQCAMKSQGIKGPSYKLLYGNTAEIIAMREKSMGKAMSYMDHNIFPRILPHVHTWAKVYGSNFLTWIGPQAQLVVTEPEIIREILSNKAENYPKIDLEGFAKKLLGDGLSSSKGEKWAKMRKLANHAFHAESLKNMAPAMVSSVEMMLEKWEKHEGDEIEVYEECRVLTSEVISKTAFGSSYLEGKKIFDMMMKLTLLVSRNVHKIKFPLVSRLVKSSDEIEAESLEKGIRDSIVKIITQREQGRIQREEGLKGDFLGKLLEANEETDQDKRMSIEDIVDECKTFYFAGHETTTSLLAWTILLLATHDEWKDKARQEVIGLFGHANPDPDTIARLKIMNMIIDESLRLYPPVPAIKRKVHKQVQIGNKTIPPNTELYISPLAIHHDPKIWGEDFHLFRPERFLEGIAKATKNIPVAFFPFGFGPRTCVGLSFAIVEAKITLSMILQRYRLTLSPTYVHSPVQLFMIRPQHGVQVILQKN